MKKKFKLTNIFIFIAMTTLISNPNLLAAEKISENKIKKQVKKVPLTVTPIAILPFSERGGVIENSGSLTGNLLFANMLSNGEYFIVEREKLDKILGELKLSGSGLVAKDSMVKVGNLIGAKIIITGTVFKAGKKTYLIAKVIGTETSRVIGVSHSGTGDLEVMVQRLSDKVIKSINKNYTKLLPKEKKINIVEWLKKNKNSLKFKKIATKIKEISDVKIDPAVEVEIEKIFTEAGFEVVKNKDDADIVISGEAFSENAGMYGGFFTGSARIELKLISKDNKIIAVDRYTQISPGVSWGVAQKNALQHGGRNILKNILMRLVKKNKK